MAFMQWLYNSRSYIQHFTKILLNTAVTIATVLLLIYEMCPVYVFACAIQYRYIISCIADEVGTTANYTVLYNSKNYF